MNKKHIYVHIPNLDHTRDLNEDKQFEPVHYYDLISFQKVFENEFGRLKTKDNDFHILHVKIRRKGCPFCNNEIIELTRVIEQVFSILYAVTCKQCGARGPILSIAKEMKYNDIAQLDIKERLDFQFSNPITWDHDFKNPYEAGND